MGANLSSPNFYQSIGLWGVVGLAPTVTPQVYPIVQFYNGPNPNPDQTSTPGSGVVGQYNGEMRGADNGAVNPLISEWATLTGVNADPAFAASPGTVINYGAWNTLRINYIAGNTIGGGSYQYVLNGTVIATQSGSIFAGVDPSTASIYEIILNSRTNGQNAYDVYWSNIVASLREEYYDAASLAPTAIVGGDALLGTYVDRRGLDWDGGKAAWMHAVGGVSSFNDGNGNVRSGISGAQFGLDLVALGDSSTRAGVTFGYSSQSSAITLPSGISGGSTIGQSPSIGAYITHADTAFYADVLGQYRFLDFGVNAPSSTGKITGGSIDVAAEAGTHIAVSDAFTLTPFVQVNYQRVMLNAGTLGGIPVSFGNSDALIGRARLLAQVTLSGLDLFASAGVSNDFLGAKSTTVSATTFASNIGGPRAEFTGGVEGTMGGGLNLFGSGEVDVSFDGKSQTYLGRAGVRKEF
jgi:hypothetical protein